MDLQAILYGLANRTTTLADKVAAAKARYTSPEIAADLQAISADADALIEDVAAAQEAAPGPAEA
jgi:hypothetical protein